jgi:hypothetical protein
MIRALALAALALACGAPAAAQQSAEVDRFVRQLYAPYAEEEPDWETLREAPMYSAATGALIDQWMAGTSPDEVEDLADFDWLCECQDWDAATFELTIAPHLEPSGDRTEVTARYHIGLGEYRQTRFVLVRENGAWLIDDQFSEAFPNGLKAAIHEAIAAQRADN